MSTYWVISAPTFILFSHNCQHFIFCTYKLRRLLFVWIYERQICYSLNETRIHESYHEIWRGLKWRCHDGVSYCKPGNELWLFRMLKCSAGNMWAYNIGNVRIIYPWSKLKFLVFGENEWKLIDYLIPSLGMKLLFFSILKVQH